MLATAAMLSVVMGAGSVRCSYPHRYEDENVVSLSLSAPQLKGKFTVLKQQSGDHLSSEAGHRFLSELQ